MQNQQSEKGDYLYTAFFSLISYARQIDTSAQKWLEEKGGKTNLNLLSIMHFLQSNIDASQLEIAKFINRDPATVTRMLDQMSKDRLIKRTPNNNDRRKWRISLTEDGELKYKKIKEQSASMISATFIGIQREEIQEIIKSLDQISKNIKI